MFWAKGYYVNTVGGNETKIRKYIQEQEFNDQMCDQLSFKEYEDPFKNVADFDDDDSPEVPADAKSIKVHGVIQPLLVRQLRNGVYQIVAGERRWRASKIAGIDEVPVIIKELSDAETMQIAMIENLQRENLDPIEEAQGYKYLADTFGMTQNEIAETVGKSRSVIANSLRLLSLPEKVVEMIGNGSLSIGHAKILLSLENQESIQQLAVKTVENNLSVRQLEELIEEVDKKPLKKKSPKKSGYFSEMELSLNEQLGRRVKIKPSADDKGKLVIEFFDKNDLKEIVKKLTEE